jgi:hypothetical protein
LGTWLSVDHYLDNLLSRGRAHFSKEEGLKALDQMSEKVIEDIRKKRATFLQSINK